MIRKHLKDLINLWGNDRKNASYIISKNKKYNSDLKAGKISGKSHPQDKKTYALYDLESAKIISKNIPKLFYEKAGIPENKYKIQGSIGQGNPAEIPWICVFDLEITKSAQEGFYIVYLFKSDMSGFYLSLNQGWTQYERKYGTKKGRLEITKNAKFSKNLLKSDQGFNYSPINLNASKSLGKGYELGNICSIYYDTKEIPAEKDLVNDLRNLIGVYRELKGLVGDEILDIKAQIDEDTFQEEIQKGNRKELETGPIQKKIKKNKSNSSSYTRNQDISFTAIDNASFKCENNNVHNTFISAKTKNPFFEAHHLIPMEFYDDFNYSIDIPENIISLCPNCHRAFHNSIEKTKVELIKKFFDLRKLSLKKRGINLTKEKLLQYYKVNENL